MTLEDRETKLPPTEALEEEEMAVIKCAGCSVKFAPKIIRTNDEGNWITGDDLLIGTVKCDDCLQDTVFRARGEVLEYRHDPDLFGQMPGGSSGLAKTLYAEAIKCFLNTTSVLRQQCVGQQWSKPWLTVDSKKGRWKRK